LYYKKNFTLTCKNNLQPGVAEISTAGKENYGGWKIVTFNINQDV
jgi:hypothetical protein